MANNGGARWNSETQTWDDGTPHPAPYTGPMPPRPTFAPPSANPSSAPSGSAGSATPGSPSRGSAMPGSATPAPPPDGPTTHTSAGYADPAPAISGPISALGPNSYSAPYSDPAPAPLPEGRRRTALVAGAVVAVIAVGFGGGYLLWGHFDETPPAARPPSNTQPQSPTSTSPTTPTSPTQQTPSSPPTSAQLPDGYRLAHDDKGFTIAVPDDWKRSVRKTGVFYTAPDDRGLVQIFEITEPDSTPRESLEKASEGLRGNPGYEEISLEPLDDATLGPDAAQLVYAYDSDRLGERVKVVDCAFTTADGRQFAVLVLGTEADWPQQERTLRIALGAFAPTGSPTS